MNIDLLHMIVTVLLILALSLAVQRTAVYQNGSRVKRFVVLGVALFIVLLVLNLIWPYGELPVFLAG